ncbi:MAG TPA: hypothetical protein DHK64_02825, partial [Rhodobiaceae bacterium]|nr:hypothetical protein [Rhodobiaceae bacterium]
MPSQTTDAKPRDQKAGSTPRIDSAPPPAAELGMWDVISRMAREYLKPHWRTAAIALLASVVVAASTGAVPVLIKYALDNIVGTDAWMLLLVSAGAIAATSL